MTALKQQELAPEPLKNIVVNGLLFNLTWFAIVATASAVWAPILAALHLLVHFSLMGKAVIEWKVVLVVSLIGLVLDQLLFYLGIFNVDGSSALPPLWLTCLWPVLATTLMHAFSGLQRRPLLAAVLGGIGGTLSFTAGTRLTNVAFESVLLGPLVIAALWTLLFPLLLQLPQLLERQAEAPRG